MIGSKSQHDRLAADGAASLPRGALRATAFLIAACLMVICGPTVAAQASDWGFPQAGAPYVLSGTSTESDAGTGHLNFTSTLLGSPVSWGCNASTTGAINAGGGGSAKIALSGCTATPSTCEIPATSLEANIELVSVGGTTYEKFVPKSGTTRFGEFAFNGASCPYAGIVAPLKGSFAALPPTNLAVERTLTFSSAANTAVGAKPTLGSAAATTEGSITEHVTGKSSTGSWRSIWEGTHGGWELQSVTGNLLTSPEYVKVSGGPMTFHFTAAWGPLTIACTGAGVEGATISPGGKENPNKFRLTGCTVTEPKSCTVPGTIYFNAMNASLQVVNGQVYEKFVPVGGSFFWLHLEGASCAHTELEWAVGGSFSASGYRGASVVQTLEFSAASEAATGSKLSWGGGSSATLTGSFNQQLSGINLGRPWGVF